MSRARRRVPIGDLPQLMKDLGKIATHPALIDGAEAAGAHVSNTAKREARFTDQTGNLRQSIFWSKPEVKRGTIRLTVGANMSYAVFIEFGAAEGAPDGDADGWGSVLWENGRPTRFARVVQESADVYAARVEQILSQGPDTVFLSL